MTIFKKDFFTNNKVLFMGVSSNPKSFSRSVYNNFIKVGIEVYPVNIKEFKIDDKSVYKSVNQLPQVPECAYILLNKENTKIAVEQLKGRGIKKILFHSKKTVDEETIALCRTLGIEMVIACPKMMINKLPIHKIHGS